ncbi:aldose epimerase family protein [Agarilytica rhodophyticola]|uniref:aldose epimerase family protein n=1 Tax=Agarilytica rhodophyticola TaxID=1737490 RepID=UPI000B341667|nr:aldose epimerase family protein [Agarilytica rhodophyticola]
MASLTQHSFGETSSNIPCTLFCLRNDAGMEAKITNFGATLVALNCFDRRGDIGNICLSYPSLSDYEQQGIFVGSVVGRFANRIGGAGFDMDGKHYSLTKNHGDNLLHGGPSTFAYRVWDIVDAGIVNDVPTLVLRINSPDGSEGFPGNIQVEITFELFNDNRLRLSMHAQSDKKTPVSLTQHGYFNLSCDAMNKKARALDSHEFQIFSDKILVADDTLVPTGEYQDVENSVFDFREYESLSASLFPLAQALEKSQGYDHNYCFEPWSGNVSDIKLRANVRDRDSGRMLSIYSTLPGMQFYTGNYIDGEGHIRYNAFCMEPQFYPDSPNKSHFPFRWVEPGEDYKHVIEWKTGVFSE